MAAITRGLQLPCITATTSNLARRIGDKESRTRQKRKGRDVRSVRRCPWKRYEDADSLVNVLPNAVSCVQTVFGNEFPYVIEVGVRPGGAGYGRSPAGFAAGLALLPQPSRGFFP